MPVTLSRTPIEEAQKTVHGRTREPGQRKLRKIEFDQYAQFVADQPDEASVFSDVEGNVQKFVLSLKAALRRLGVDARVSKKRNQPIVTAWIVGAANAPEDDDDSEETDEETDEEATEEEEEEEETSESERALAGMARR